MSGDGEERMAVFAKEVFAGCTFNSLFVESSKGCVKKIFSYPVMLEPLYERFDATRIYRRGKNVNIAVANDKVCGEWFVCRLKVPLFDKVDWDRVEAVLFRLSGFCGVVSFEVFVCGNDVTFFLGCSSKQLLGVLCGVWQGAFPGLVVLECDDSFMRLRAVKGGLCFFDLYPSPPYYRRMNGERLVSSLASFIKIASGLKGGECCFYQTLFCPVRNDWHFNVRSLVASESFLGARSPFGKTASGMVKDLCKPLFAVAVRFGCVSKNSGVASALRNFCGSFLHVGKPFCFRTEKDFGKVLSKREISEMLLKRIAYCPGFILDSGELCSFVHFPDSSVKSFSLSMDVAKKSFRVPKELLGAGRPLGFNCASGKEVLVRLPDSLHNKGCWLIGRSRSGKSTTITNQFCWHVENVDNLGGACLIDPHRVTAREILGFLPLSVVGRTAFLDFDDDSYVLDYCPFDEDNEEFFGRMSTEIVNSLKNLFDAGNYYRMSHLLGRAVYALFVLKKNLSTIPVLFSRTAEGERLRKEVVAKVRNVEVQRFWQSDYYSYGREAFMPISNRLSSLFMDFKAQRIFSREKNKVDIGRFMDEGWAVLVALPSSVDISCTIGGMLAADFQKASFLRVGRKNIRPFYLFIDEFYRVGTPRIIQSIIDECVKGGLHVCLANQETGQLSDDLLKAVLSLPNIFVFNVNLIDAKQLMPIFNNRVSVDDIISLGTGEVFGNIYGSVVDFTGLEPKKDFNKKVKDMIIAWSRKNFYTPLAEIKKQVRVKSKKRVFDSF
jgi:hypothetical protein